MCDLSADTEEANLARKPFCYFIYYVKLTKSTKLTLGGCAVLSQSSCVNQEFS